jgi:uncharacterized protein
MPSVFWIMLASCLWLPVAYGATSDAQLAAAVTDLERAQMAQVHAFLKDGGDPNARNEYGRTLLHTAVNWNQRDAVKALLEKSADPNLCFGECPIYVAAGGDTEILRLLVASGADVNRKTPKYGYTPLIRVAGNRPETFESLRREGGYHGPAPDALESVRILIAAGADVNHVDDQEQSPLRIAMFAGNFDIAKALLEAGANVRWRASPSSTTILMETILSYSPHEDPVAVHLLLDYGADPNDRSEKAYTPGCEQSRGGCYWRGYSALTFAARYGFYRVVKLLLERGADPSLPRTDGRTALELARDNKHPKTAALIEQYLARKTSPAVTAPTNPESSKVVFYLDQDYRPQARIDRIEPLTDQIRAILAMS